MYQLEFKFLLSDLVPHGKRKPISKRMGVSEGEICRRFNPNDGRKLATAEGLREQRAIFEECPKEFHSLREAIESVWDSWEAETGTEDLLTLYGELAKESGEAMSAQFHDQALHVKRKEMAEALGTARRCFNCLRKVS